MNNFYKIIFSTILLFGNFLLNAQAPPPPGGGSGGTTPESAAAPIDMYTYILVIVAMVLITYFVKKSQKKIA